MLFAHTAREAALSGSLDSITADQEEGGAKLLYPMYLMSWTVVMNLTRMIAHQEMQARGELVEWTEELLGRVILISHEWLGYTHPDPTGEQLRALQGALRQLALGEVCVQHTWKSQLFLKENEMLHGKHLSVVLPTCKFWLDFSGVPQDITAERSHRDCNDHRYSSGSVQQDMANAISSIPAYVERSSLILVLTPTAQHTDVPGRVCGFPSYRGRGWCRVELMASSVSRARVRVMCCSGAAAPPELLLGPNVLLPPGEGVFTCCARGHVVNGHSIPCDKPRIGRVLEDMLEAGAEHLRRVGNVQSHRYLLCNKSRWLRGLPAQAVAKGPGGGVASPAAALRGLLRWGGLDDDLARAGQAPSLLHWAAMAGDAAVLRELMSAGWSGDAPMNLGLREFGWPSGLLPLHMAAASADGAPDAALALLDLGANPHASAGALKVVPFMWLVSLGSLQQLASWLDYFPGWDVERCNEGDVYGLPAVAVCAMMGAESAPRLQLLLGKGGANVHAGSHMHGADSALYAACWKEDSDPQAVRLLLDARCSPNMAVRPARCRWKAIYGIARAAVLFKGCRGQQPGSLVAMLAEQSGSTPLHAAARRGDVQVMRVLLEARADPDRRNDMGRTPLGLAALSFGGVAPGPVEAVLRGGVDAGEPEGSAQPDIAQGLASVTPAFAAPLRVTAGRPQVTL